MKAFIKSITAFLRKTWEDAVLESDESFTVPAPPTYTVSPHVVHHTPTTGYLNQEPVLSFEEDYVDAPQIVRRKRASRFATEEERRAHIKEVQRQSHKKRYADPAYRQKCIDRMRQRRGKTAETTQGYSKRNLGISAKDRKAYNQAYYAQVKKTGNTAKTFNK